MSERPATAGTVVGDHRVKVRVRAMGCPWCECDLCRNTLPVTALRHPPIRLGVLMALTERVRRHSVPFD